MVVLAQESLESVTINFQAKPSIPGEVSSHDLFVQAVDQPDLYSAEPHE